jgi:hypothetical protein
MWPTTTQSIKLKQYRRRQRKGISESADIDERDVSLAPLDAPEITTRESAFQRKLFLRPLPLLTQGRNTSSKQDSGI